MPVNECTVSIVGRLVFTFAKHRFVNFHGQKGARLRQSQDIHGEWPKRRGALISTTSWFLFAFPDMYLDSLAELRSKNTRSPAEWEKMIERLQKEWQDFVLFATVLLNANVAFLSVPGVSANGAARIMSYLSTVTSLGSIVLGLLLISLHRVRPGNAYFDVIKYLVETKTNLAAERLVITYCLPYALLMWSMLAFTVAFLLACFVDAEPVAMYVTAAGTFIVGLLFAWYLYIAYLWRTWDLVWFPVAVRMQRAVAQRIKAVCGDVVHIYKSSNSGHGAARLCRTQGVV